MFSQGQEIRERQLADAYHYFGNDLIISASGDILVTSNSDTETTQRVLRRLLTNPGQYIWNLSYGAGIPARVGTPTAATAISAIITQQMQLEAGVAQSPPPTVSVTATATGYMFANVSYTDAVTQITVPVTLPTG
jgi:hypothetical protein